MNEQLIDIGLYIAYALVIIAAGTAIIMNVINSISNPKSLVKSGIGIGVLGVVFLISYSMAPTVFDNVSREAFILAEFDPDSESFAGTYKWVGGAMTTTLILFALAVVGLVYSTVAKLIG